MPGQAEFVFQPTALPFFAASSKAWLSASDVAVGASGRSSPQDLGPNMAGLMQLPFAFVADGLETMGAMWQDCLPKPGP